MKRTTIRVPSTAIPKTPPAYDPPARDPFVNAQLAFDTERAVEEEVSEINEALREMGFLAKPNPGDGVPLDKPLQDRSKKYEAEVAGTLAPRITQVREFFLMEVLPLMMASHNGLSDAVDVVKLAIKEEPQAAKFIQFFNLVLQEAVKAKTVNFIQNLAGLTPEEKELFLAAFEKATPKEKPNDLPAYLSTVLREVQQVHGMSRSLANEAKASLRKLRSDEGDSLAPRSRRGTARTKRK